MSFIINKFFGVAQLLNRTVASVSATGSRLLGGGPVCNDAKTRTDGDTAAVTASAVSGNGHLVRPAAPPRPLNHQKPILAVDLDHTLIHGFIGAKEAKLADLHTTGYQPSQILRFRVNGQSCVVFKRPGVEKFLLEMSKHYDLVLWTAGTQLYADPIVDWLDPEKVIFSKRMYRTECTQSRDGRFVKDLNKLQVALSRVLILDNSEKSYAFQPANGVPISDFTTSNSDTDLLCGTYVSILRDASKLQDVREGITDAFRNSVKQASEFVSYYIQTRAARNMAREHLMRHTRKSARLSKQTSLDPPTSILRPRGAKLETQYSGKANSRNVRFCPDHCLEQVRLIPTCRENRRSI